MLCTYLPIDGVHSKSSAHSFVTRITDKPAYGQSRVRSLAYRKEHMNRCNDFTALEHSENEG